MVAIALLGGLLLLSNLLLLMECRVAPLGDLGRGITNGEEIEANASNPVLLVPKGESGFDDGPAIADEKLVKGFGDEIPTLVCSALI